MGTKRAELFCFEDLVIVFCHIFFFVENDVYVDNCMQDYKLKK